ncbi:MAG: glycosyltransferase [Candidatus Marinimicrobia bacterium]|nr:glycosyltransferase [Candidatus Neomarinimicrobiota bacterium]MBL7046839.1 glycosyltransferase [Candidatus Neomarinimicrobiota bacterium]
MMTILAAVFTISLILYSCTLLLFILGLFRQKEHRYHNRPFVSVIIPAKNEKDHIENILYDVTHQTYPKDKYEIIIVDDESTDVTPNICNAYVEKYQNVKLLSTNSWDSSLRYKKKPLDLGIKNAAGEILLFTDADCHVLSTWIETMVSYFTPEVGLVIGYSELVPYHTLLEKIQTIDFFMLMNAARGCTQLGLPFACTGQNLAYRKKAFEEVGGFSSFADSVGGDDTLFLQQIKKKTSWNISFAINPGAYVSSSPTQILNQLLTQRIRWAADSLSIKHTDPLFFSIIITTFLANLTPLLLMISLIFSGSLFLLLLKGLLIKFIMEAMLMMKGTSTFQRQEIRSIFPAWFFFQIPYVVTMGFISLLGNRFPWGGRFN